MTRDELLELPAVLTVEQAARVLDVSLSTARLLVRSGEWPSPVLRLGAQYRIPTAPLLAVLGVDAGHDEGGPARAADVPADDPALRLVGGES